MKRYTPINGTMTQVKDGKWVLYSDVWEHLNRATRLTREAQNANKDAEELPEAPAVFSVSAEQVIAGIYQLQANNFNIGYGQLVNWLRAQFLLTKLGATESIEKAIAEGLVQKMIISGGCIVSVVE